MELYVIYFALLVILIQVSRLNAKLTDLTRIRKTTNETYWMMMQRNGAKDNE